MNAAERVSDMHHDSVPLVAPARTFRIHLSIRASSHGHGGFSVVGSACGWQRLHYFVTSRWAAEGIVAAYKAFPSEGREPRRQDAIDNLLRLDASLSR